MRTPPYSPNTFIINGVFQPCGYISIHAKYKSLGDQDHSHSRKALAKLMHTFAFQLLTPRLAAVSGILAVWISSSFVRIPCCERKPTMILGTPSKNDWIQNFMSLRSKFCIVLSSRISTLVLSSIQLIGAPFSTGLESQTDARVSIKKAKANA